MSEANDDKGVSVDIHLHVHFSASSNQPAPQMPQSNSASSLVSETLTKIEQETQAVLTQLDAVRERIAVRKSSEAKPAFRFHGRTFHEANQVALQQLRSN